MSEPKHWQKDGAPSDFARLFDAANAEQPGHASLQRALVAAGIVGAASLVSTSAAATAGNIAGKGVFSVLAKWAIVGAVSAGAVATTAVVVKQQPLSTPAALGTSPRQAQRGKPQPATHQRETVSAQRDQLEPGAAASSLPSAFPQESVGSAPTARLSAPIAERSRSGPTEAPRVLGHGLAKSDTSSVESTQRAPSARESDHTLSEEMALVDSARASLRAGDAVRALQNASAYEHRFPSGRFAPEALYVIMQARKHLGQRAAADTAREIIRRFPDGPQVGRAREVLQSQGEDQIP